MSRMRQIIFIGILAAALPLLAQNPPGSPGFTVTNLLPPAPQLQSPVVFFRQLLAMTPLERNHSLSNRPPEVRDRILAKIREYQALGPDERELRLRATELRWYLTPLLRLAPADRADRLALVPEDLRGLVQSRLMQWNILPPPLQKEILHNDRTLHFFARIEPTNSVAGNPEAQKIAEGFNLFFELTPAEKQQTLSTLSEAERGAMAATLQTFEHLPVQQRLLCVRNYAKFAGMSTAERAEFLKNAEKWSQMSPAERQTWRDLVAHVPIWPPMPGPLMPANPMPPLPSRPAIATNRN